MAVESSPQHVQQPQQQQQHMTADTMSRGVKRHSPLRPEESGDDESPKKKSRKEDEEYECLFCGRCFNDRALCGLHICNIHITQMLQAMDGGSNDHPTVGEYSSSAPTSTSSPQSTAQPPKSSSPEPSLTSSIMVEPGSSPHHCGVAKTPT